MVTQSGGRAVAALALTLASGTACGSTSSDDHAAGRDSQPSTASASSTGAPDGPADARVIAVLQGSGVGPTRTGPVIAVDTPEGVDRLTSDIEDQSFVRRIRRAALDAKAPDGMRVGGAVAYIGCESPRRFTVTVEGRARVEPAGPAEPEVQCFVEMTTVVIVAVDEDAL